jgi:ABC-2 type transport system permease protein
MRILDLAIKDWMQLFRDWKTGLFLIVMPVLFTIFFGLIMGPALNPTPDGDARLPVGLVNQDTDGLLTPYIEGLLEDSSSIRLVVLTEEEISHKNELVREGDVAAFVTIPENYSRDLLDDKPVRWNAIVDQNSPAGQTASTAIETAVNRLRGAVETAHLSTEAFVVQDGFESKSKRQSYFVEAVNQALAEWEQPPLSTKRELATGDISTSDSTGTLDGFVQASSGMMVQFAIFGLITSAMVLVLERKNKTLQRLLTTPMKRWEIIAGHMLAMFTVIFLQETLLVIFGQLMFDVNYTRQPLAVLIMMVTLALWAASLGLLISALARGEEQVVTLSLIAMFLFASLGGAWFPLEVAGKTFAAIGHIMPTAWAMDGFQNLLMRGLGLQSVFLPTGMLGLYALAFFSLAIWRFEFE